VIAKGRLSPAKRARETNVEEIGVWMSGLWPGAHTDDLPAQTGDAPVAAQA
jgi:simple sugar transport system ATP-binding protein